MKPSLALNVEIEQASGRTYRWDANAPEATDRPSAITFSTKLMDGFTTAKVSLARRITRAWPDLGLYDTIRFIGAGGHIAYEGRIQRATASNVNGHRIDVNAVGWMTHMHDRPIPFLGVDRNMSSWGAATAARDADLATAGYAPKGPGVVTWDRALAQSWEGAWISGELPVCHAWFDAGPGQGIGYIYYACTPGVNVSEADPNWTFAVFAATDTSAGGLVNSGDLQGAPANSGLFTVAAGKRYGLVQFYNEAAGGVADTQYRLDWDDLVVYGDHGLELIGSTDPKGLRGSDVLKHVVGLAAPRLDTSRVLATDDDDAPVDQFVYRKATSVYEMCLRLNARELRNLAVWENRRLYWESLDTDTVDWLARLDQGTRVSFEGPSTEGSANGVSVSFQNIITGQADMIDPTTDATLADDNPALAANRAALRVWPPIQLSDPQSPATAARIGAAVLTDYNRQKYPCRVTIRGHIMDPVETWQQGWRPRAGETIALQDYDDAPARLIHETTWDHDTRTLRMDLDADAKTIDALIDQAQTTARRR